MSSNKGTAYQFRNDVLLLLHDSGFTAATKPSEPKGVEPSEKRPRGDVVGMPVTLACRSGSTKLDLSGALNEVQREAHAEGHDVYASVHKRRGHPVEQAFVVTDLTTWLRVLARLHPEAVTS